MSTCRRGVMLEVEATADLDPRFASCPALKAHPAFWATARKPAWNGQGSDCPSSDTGIPDSGNSALGHLCHDRHPYRPGCLLHRHHGGDLSWAQVQAGEGQYPWGARQAQPGWGMWSSPPHSWGAGGVQRRLALASSSVILPSLPIYIQPRPSFPASAFCRCAFGGPWRAASPKPPVAISPLRVGPFWPRVGGNSSDTGL